MRKKLYTIKEASHILDKYIEDSAKRLKKGLKEAWAKNQSFAVHTPKANHESLLHR